jgi:prolyl-tRNA synthetase
MAFSRLLLAAVTSKKYIQGEGKTDKLFVYPQDGEIALCFQIDDKEKHVPHILDLNNNNSRCDGLIFYAKDGEEKKVICLVEMKSTHVDKVAGQIEATKRFIEQMLRQECGSHSNKLLSRVTWKACFYSYGTSDSEKKKQIKDALKKCGFDDVADFEKSRDDVSAFLRGELNARNIAGRYKHKRC